MASDAFIVGEEWISEHFFTTDSKSQSFGARVLQRRKEWDELADDSIATPRSRFLAIRPALSTAFAHLAEMTDADRLREQIYTPLTTAFGYAASTLDIMRRGPLVLLRPADFTEGASLAVIEARSVEQFDELLARDNETLLEPYFPEEDENHPLTSVARLLSRVFLSEERPQFAVVLAGHWALLAERTRWPEGRYLAIDLQLVTDRNHSAKGGEIDHALACLAAESLIPSEEGTVWWNDVLADSIKHTVGVSQDLRDGVRRSIELIANDVVARRSAQGLDPLLKDKAQELALESLRYLYRILFLLFAEASPELEVVPTVVGEYEDGYGLGRLRELVQVELSHDAASRRHIYDSLAVLYRQVDQGHTPPMPGEDGRHEGLRFNALKADLFAPAAIALIDEVGLSDGELQRVLAHLLLSKEKRGSDRGFISYANLGINQLGAVYEGLMSYTGFFAETDLYEVAKDGDSSKGSWVVQVDRSDDIAPKDFVTETDPLTGETKPVLHPVGSFVYRLAGRERQQSASYYTPEVLTRFVVSQALEELLDETATAADILTMTVCEPALGSGAFAIEAVRQLAEEYLKRRQKELGRDIDPDAYPKELQKAKASIALHQVYGVDLNSTAVELAEISLWLDTMVAGLDAPWFGLHLRRGNSLIGARRAVYSRDQVMSKAFLKDVPRVVSVVDLAENLESGAVAKGTAGAIHHFLLPAEGWGSAAEAKEAKELAPEALTALKAWRRTITSKLSQKQTDQLVNLSYRVETLWQFALRRLQIAEREVRRSIDVWQAEEAPEPSRSVQRSEIERKINDSNGAFQRLRRVMDAWNALWFWPLTPTLNHVAQPPTIDEWIAGLTAVLGAHFEAKGAATMQGAVTLGPTTSWADLGFSEEYDLNIAGAKPIDDVLAQHPWLGVTEGISEQQGFFHWELDFATVFARGGFDLQVGNPPWVRPDWDEGSALAEFDVWFALAVKAPVKEFDAHRSAVLAAGVGAEFYLDTATEVAATRNAVSSTPNFPTLEGLRPDLYRCFMEQSWRHSSERGITGLIHPETHFTDEKAGRLRSATYARLRRHWQFVNELTLFEIHHLVSYGVHVYGPESGVQFEMATSLYHPDTVERSIAHDGTGEEPGLKDPDGHWDLRAHRNRIVTVNETTLRTWHAVLEDETVPIQQTRMLYAVNRATADVLSKLSLAPRLGALRWFFSPGLIETQARQDQIIDYAWGVASAASEVVLQGPNFFVSNPAYKYPNATMLNNKDWVPVDLETLRADALPVTSYKPVTSPDRYRAAYPIWKSGDRTASSLQTPRVAWRGMAANTGERTLIPTLLPTGFGHINGVFSAGSPDSDPRTAVLAVAWMSSLIADFMIRAAPKSGIYMSAASRVPVVIGSLLEQDALVRAGRLNCLTSDYASYWDDLGLRGSISDWAGGKNYLGRPSLGDFAERWDDRVPLRRSSDRRQALVEIDAIVALILGITADELCTVYRTQFAVLYGYDRNAYFYDANGRLVPNSVLTIWRNRGESTSVAERTATNATGNTYTYELPFETLDREADMRQAYAHFECVLADRS